MTARVFASDRGESSEVIFLNECFFDEFSMEYIGDGVVEFWFRLDAPLTDTLHRFVKDYAFTRFGVDFEPKQRSLLDVMVADAAASMQKLADEDHATLTFLDDEGNSLAQIKPKGRVQ